MYTGSLAPVSNREDWIVQSPLIDDDGAEVVLTSATFQLDICKEGCPTSPVLSGTLADGTFTLPTTTSFQWWFTPDDMGSLCAGTYEVFLRVTIAGVTTQILSCSVPIVEGGPS